MNYSTSSTPSELQTREERCGLACSATQIGIWDWNLVARKITWNREAVLSSGLDAAATQTHEIETDDQAWFATVDPRDLDRVKQTLDQALANYTAYEVEYRVLHADGSLHWLLSRGQGFYDEANQPIRMVGIVMEISDRKRDEVVLKLAEEAWQENQQLLDAIMANLPGGVFRCFYASDSTVRFAYASEAYRELLGLSPQEMTTEPKHVFDRFHPDDQLAWDMLVKTAQTTLEPSYSEHRVILASGAEKWLGRTARFSWAANGDFVVDGVDIDITDRKRAEAQIQQLNQDLEARVEQRTQELSTSLHEQEELLKEVHHRVKNNLQMIQSLLSLQARAIDNPQTLAALAESQQRIKTMALVHEKLYQSHNLARINFCSYVKGLTRDLLQSYAFNSATVQLSIQVAELELPIDTVIPCGLIINELFSNAIKYAFPEHQSGHSSGHITVEFSLDRIDRYILIVADDGIGLPDTINAQTTKSLGLRLVHALIRQLQGTLEIDRCKGTKFTITFAKSPAR